MTGNGAHRKRDSVDSGQSTVRLTRTLSQEIRDLKTREAQYERAYSPPHSSSTSSSLRHSSASLGAIIHGSYGDVSELGHDDSVLEDSQHGNGAALSAIQREERKQKERLRLMVVDMLFSAARGRLSSCKKKMAAVEAMGLLVTDPGCCDYDKRTPLHLAAAEGSFKVTEWLLREKRANPNSIDRFGSTPLQGAIWGDHKMIVSLLVENGAKLQENGNLVDYKPLHAIGSFCDLTKLQRRLSGSGHSGLGLADPQNGANLLCLEDEFWEISEDAVTREEKLGEGEFGTVYKALWGETPVAVKVLKHSDNLAIGEFVTEMNMMRKLHHPHIVQFLGGCTRTKPYFIVTELARGKSLLDYFQGKLRLPHYRELELAIDCARGMAYLHSSAIRKPATLHRDLKPANLMIFGTLHGDKRDLLERSGTLKVTDFGLSKTLADIKPSKKNYRLTGETGSYRYMAPEVYKHKDYNHKVDVYAYAMILFQLFERTAPFPLLEPQQAAVAASKNGLRPKFAVLNKRPALKDLIERCWAQDPDDRPEFKEVIPLLEKELRGAHKQGAQEGKKKKWYSGLI